MSFADDFLHGQIDCRSGEEHKAGNSEAYDQGYAAEYEREQLLTEMELWTSKNYQAHYQ